MLINAMADANALALSSGCKLQLGVNHNKSSKLSKNALHDHQKIFLNFYCLCFLVFVQPKFEYFYNGMSKIWRQRVIWNNFLLEITIL